MKISKKQSQSRSSRVMVPSLPRVVRSVIDVVAHFGSGNVVNSTLPGNTPRSKLRSELRRKWRNITKAIVTFPNSDSTILEFGKHRVSNLEA